LPSPCQRLDLCADDTHDQRIASKHTAISARFNLVLSDGLRLGLVNPVTKRLQTEFIGL
jgi:hypothetical protein